MSANVPIISVTADSNRRDSYEHHYTSTSSDSDDSYSNDMDYNHNAGGLTDVEEFDVSARAGRPLSRKSSKSSLLVPKDLALAQGDLTDVEDYNDSEADGEEDKSTVYPELKLSLQQFLQHDFEERLSTSDGMKKTVEHKSGNFLQAQNLNAIDDYLTDCEAYNTDSEIENGYEKSACFDLKATLVEQGRVSITDTTLKEKQNEDCDCDNDDASVVSDISGLALALSDVTGKELQGMSEDEILELSNEAEVCQISCSDSVSTSNTGNISEDGLLSSASLPPIDVAFIHATNKSNLNKVPFVQIASAKGGLCKNMFLEVKGKRMEEVLTDTERFDDSVAEGDDDDSFDGDEDNQQPIPQAVFVTVDDDGGCATDCDDLLYDDVSETAVSVQESAPSVDLNALPLPQREIVMLQEDKFGDTITSVMPMDKEYQFGIYATPSDACLTDTEEYSCTDDLDAKVSLIGLPERSPSPLAHNVLVEHDVTIANEMLKTQQSKRLEIISNTESVTDVEEIYIAGTNSRKKKLKSRATSKSKSKFLEAPKSLNTKEDGSGTDIEDMDLSDSGLSIPLKGGKKVKPSRQLNHSHSEKVTDVEDITVDDVSFVSEAELPLIDANTSIFKDYEASSKNIVVTMETCASVACTKYVNHRKPNNADTEFLRETCFNTNHNLQQQQTDIEDVQLPSDTEECMNIGTPTVDCICHELNEMLNESCTTVHEKCSNSFNIDAEKLHIKGMLRESHTDIEYVESDESAARGSK